jgi:exodeoxyribonuclease V alpha subunit
MPGLSPFGAASQAMGKAPGFPADLVELLATSDLDEGGAFLAWQLAALASGLAPAERDSLAILVGRLLVAQASGSTRLAVGEKEQAILARAPEITGPGMQAGAARTPLVLDGNYLYTERAHACEARVAARLDGLMKPGPFSPSKIKQAVDEAAVLGLPMPSDEQKAAVASALGLCLGVISGGPGTGKTTTALLLVRTLARLGVPPATIALAAPTGKAKSRLEEDFRARLGQIVDAPRVDRELFALCPEAQTLHHMLGATAGPDGFLRAARDPLPYRAVIVDESSMIDLVLMTKLLDALPAGSQLVLLGDADQLPSVSAGAVFRDLGPIASRLGRGFRTDPSQPAGSQMVALGKEVRAGAADAAAALCSSRGSVAELRRQGAEHISSEHRDELLRWHHARLFDAAPVAPLARHVFSLRGEFFDGEDADRLDSLATHLGKTRVLSVTRQGGAGVERSNAFLHDLHGDGPPLVPGEPVLMLRNDYERDLWNGDQGIVVRVARIGQPAVTLCAFRSRKGWLAVDPFAMGSALSLGYALTVHKAQGSEYDEVLLLLPDHDCPLLTRELVYTAISRARRSVIVCGSLDTFKSGVAAGENRSSGIGERLTLQHKAT